MRPFTDFVKKHATLLGALIVMFAPLISEGCHCLWFQPEEPSEFRNYIENRKEDNQFDE